MLARAWIAAFALVSSAACSLLVSDEGYVGDRVDGGASADGAPSDSATADARDGADGADRSDGGDAEADATPLAPVCLSSVFVDAFERGDVVGNGWAALASTTSTRLEISQAEYVSGARSLLVAADPVDSGFGSVVYLSRALGGGCVDLTFSVRALESAAALTLVRVTTSAATNAPTLRARLDGASLSFAEESNDLGTRELAAVPIGTTSWRRVHVRWDGAPALVVDLDGAVVSPTNAPLVPFSATVDLELGVPRRSASTSGRVHVDDVTLR
jgi:hypothetical protein